MRRIAIALSGAALAIVPYVAANRPQAGGASLPDHPPVGQLPVMPPGQNPGSGPSFSDHPVQPKVRLGDTLGSNRALTTFSSLARKEESIESLLVSTTDNTTVLAPVNSAVEALPRKPWEDPRDVQAYGAQAYDGSGGKDRADQNLRRFVEAHLVTRSPWRKDTKAKTVGGREIWWEEKDGKMVIMPDEVEVDKVAIEVANGQLWILKGVLNYA
ncbi:hypothetical protein K4F52_003846 [Lecanicillium sp. MT-2017a]|nr:hypothetical protein K4F52_003846 [Lecanicillium sp. MT-2017a]